MQTTFDARKAKTLQPGEAIVFAAEHPGLRLEATETKRTWTYRYRHPVTGQMKQMRLGHWPAMGLSAAVEQWEKARADRGKGVDVAAAARAVKVEKKQKAAAQRRQDVETCGWLIEAYLGEVVEPNRKAKGAAETRRMLERAIAAVKNMPARSVGRVDAHKIVRDIAEAGAVRIAAMTRQALRAAWEHGIAIGVVEENPFLGATVGGKLKTNARKRALSLVEAGKLLHWMREPGSYSRSVGEALELTLRTGLRSGEVVGIHTRELTERGGVLWLDIPAERMKQGEPHSVPLLGRAAEIVRLRSPGEGGYLFPTRQGDKPMAQKVLGVEQYAHSGRSKAAIYAQKRVCPVSDWTVHDLRRTARTLLADLGCPYEVGESILAHALPGVAKVYNRAQYEAAKVDWLTKLGAHLDAAAAA